MIKRILEFREEWSRRYISPYVGLPIFIGFFLPNIFEPEIFWRLISWLVLLCNMIALMLVVIILPEQVYRDYKENLGNGARYVTVVGCLLIMWILPKQIIQTRDVALDLVRYMSTKDRGLTTEIMTVDKNEYGGSVTPWFISQRMTINGEEYTLPLSFTLYAPGTYTVTYSPKTKIIYEVR